VSDPASVSLVHLGCARNLIDSELILARMAEEGLRVTGDPQQAHTVVLNTCSFIGPAREESYASIRGLVERKLAGDLGHVIVAGCLVQRYRTALREQFPDVDIFAEISNYRALAKEIKKLSSGRPVRHYLESPGLRPADQEDARLLATPGSYAYLRISHGCDHTCSFCAIPGIRGPHRSKRPSAVLAEAEQLIDAGVRELVLVAEDSTAWGRDFGMELPELVESLAELDGEATVRVMYAYPNRFPWDLARLMREHPKVLPYLDIPTQHIATPVLRAMRRHGSGDEVRRILDRLMEEVPGLTLRSTLLVGFPGETEQHVDELCEHVKTYGLGRLGAFAYSPEEDTPGFELENTVSKKEAAARLKAVLAARDAALTKTQESQVGEAFEVLVDEATDGEGIAVARSVMDAPEVDPRVFVECGERKLKVGERVSVKVNAVGDELDLWADPQ
jgi:ribosomal protein S12 methylthiotransferase